MIKRDYKFGEARALVRFFNNELRFRRKIDNYTPYLKREIDYSLIRCKEDDVKRRLKSTRVEQLNGVGNSKASLLSLSGYKHISDLVDCSYYELQHIYGITNSVLFP